jgi:hypothetical protein
MEIATAKLMNTMPSKTMPPNNAINLLSPFITVPNRFAPTIFFASCYVIFAVQHGALHSGCEGFSLFQIL